MTLAFVAQLDPTLEQFESLAGLDPENPFLTREYAESMRASSRKPILLGLRDGERLNIGCVGFLKVGRFGCHVEIPSIPSPPEAEAARFWDGLFDTCRKLGVTELEANSYASRSTAIPKSPRETGRNPRVEYVIDLRQDDMWRPVRSTHRQRIAKARKAGVTLRRTIDEEAAGVHARMMSASMSRRRDRGEDLDSPIDVEPLLATLRSGAGVLFQAVREDQVLSSMMVLLSAAAGYDQTSGTAPEGMERGASQFLIFETAMKLREEGKTAFNLGGVSEVNPGLHEFKRGFGPEERSLETARFALGSPLKRMLLGTARAIRERLR
jgi:hypothetical protein